MKGLVTNRPRFLTNYSTPSVTHPSGTEEDWTDKTRYGKGIIGYIRQGRSMHIDTYIVSIVVVGRASERCIAVRSGIEMDKCNTLWSCLFMHVWISSLSSFIAERNAERQYALPHNNRVRLGRYKVKLVH